MGVWKGHCSSIFSWIRWDTPNYRHRDFFCIQMSYLIAPTQARCIATDFIHLCKSFSYLKYVQSTFLCDHSCICRNRFYWPYRCPIYVQVGQLRCGNSLRASLRRPESLPGMLLSTPRQSSSVYQLVYAQQQLPRGNLQGCLKFPPGEQLMKLVKHFIAKPVGAQQSTLWRISPLKQKGPMSHLCRDWLGSFWNPTGNEWLSALGARTGKSLLSQL